MALIGTGILRGWIDDWLKLLVGGVLTLGVTAWIGHLVGLAGWIDVAALWRQHGEGPFQFALLLGTCFLHNYWTIYGPQNFCASLLVGCFLAWAWGVKVLPHLTGDVPDDMIDKPIA